MSETVVARRAARVLLVDPADRPLLFRGGDPGRPSAGTWWFTVGGGIQAGETVAAAASRELAEETGLVIDDPGPVVHRRLSRFEFDGTVYDQAECCFPVRAATSSVDTGGWGAAERRAVLEHRWWPLEQLRRTDALGYPENLADLVGRLLDRVTR